MIRAQDLSQIRRFGALAFLLVAYFFYAWSWNTVDILRPFIKESLNLSDTAAGSAYTVQAIGAIIGAVIMGQIADKIGRRNALVFAMIGYGAFLLSGLLVTTYPLLIGQRLGLGFFLGSMFPIAVGIYSGLFAKAIRGKIAGIVFATYNAAVAALSFLSAAAFRNGYDWSVLLWAGAVPVALAVFALMVIPDDRYMIPYDGCEDGLTTARSSVPVAELFKPGVAKQTLLLALMIGLNFLAYQCFNGWGTTFLKDNQGIPNEDVGDVWGWLLIGQLFGSFLWGWIGDRYGRRVVGWGFIGAAIIVPVYVFAGLGNNILFVHPWYLPVPDSPLKIIGIVYGVMLSASVVWGPWLSELYPSHLRSTAASIFNWGRVISMLAPLVTGKLAEIYPLPIIMSAASVAFVTAALIWFRLPETMDKKS
jgi:MFS family permease